MVEASNILGIDAMIGHWEFTYNEAEVLSNIALFKGDFIGQIKPLHDHASHPKEDDIVAGFHHVGGIVAL